MRYLIFLLFLLPLCCLGQSVPGCYNYVAQTPITATSNTTISGFLINCNGAATPGITIPAGVHDVHITKCKIQNSTTPNGLIYISSGCYNITIDTCFFQSGWRGIYAVGATNNIHIWYNFFYNIIDPNVTATSSDGGGASVQLNACTGTSIQILDNRSYHDVSSSGVGDQFSLYKCNGTVASPIRICRNQALNGSTNPPSTGYAGAVAGDAGGGYQRVDSNTFVNTGAVGAQVQGGHDIEMSYNTIFLGQTTYTSVALAFGNYSGTSSSNITISYNNARCIQPNGNVFNFWFDPKTAFQPTGWSTNTTSTGLNANILPNPLWSACTLTVLPPNISYTPSAYTFTMGTAITPFTPANSGSIASFTATLPTGLTINPSTGTISGTPTIGSPATNYTVTAINTAGSSSATINVGVISTDAALKSMVLSSGTLSPTFCSCTGNYTASVANSVSSITITPTVNQANATVTVNGIPVTSGTTSGAISLTVGANIIRTVVTAQSGATNTYTVTITRAASTDATLSSLAISNGTLSPAFASATTSYSANVGSSVSSITLTPAVNEPNATVTVNGVAVASGNASVPVSLATGSNIISTVVTAQDGSTTKTYTLTVTRPPSSTIINFSALAPATYGDSPITLAAGSNNTDVGATITYSSDNTSVATVSGNTVTIVGAGTANITASETATTNFMAAQNVTQGLTVNKANLTITANDQHKVYGSGFTFNGTEFTTSGLVTGDMVNSITLLSDGAAALAATGTYPITPSAATGNGLANYIISYSPGIFTVNGINLTFAAIPSQVYGAVDFDPGATSQSAISYTSSNSAVATIVNGNIHIVGVGSSTITATSVNVSQTQTLTVTPAPLTITANDVNKTYGTGLNDGNASNAFSASGIQNSETIGNVIIDYGLGGASDAAIGTYTASVTPSGAAGGTFTPNNYNITYLPGDIIVGKTPLTITANNGTKVYGTTQVFAGTEFVATGLQNGDAVNAVTLVSAGAAVSAPASNYAIIPSAPVSAQGTDLSNYTIQFVNGTDAVGQALLTITADNQNMLYGSQVPALTVSYSGFVNNETSASLDHLPLVTTTATTGSAVGSYPITVNGAVDNNYTFNYVGGTLSINAVPLTFNSIASQTYGTGDFNPGATSGSPITYTSSNTSVATILAGLVHIRSVGTTLITANNGSSTASQTLTVTPVDLIITADNLSKIQGQANPPLTISYSGLVNGDTKNNLTAQPTITTTATTNSPEGSYPITPANAVDANYNISYVPGTLTVTALALTFASIPTKTYGNVDFDPGAASSSPITYTSSNTSVATIVNGYVHIVGAGSSTITADDSKTSIGQTLTVTAAALTVSADNQTKTYGADNPPLTISYNGFVNGEDETSLNTLPTISTNADANSIVGTYPITVNGAADPNYSIAYNNGTLSVTKAPLSIKANSQSRNYGDPNPPLTVSYAGFMNNETAISLDTQPTVSTTAAINSAPGNYPITASGAADANYSISYVQGTMTVNGIALTFNPIQSQAYGSADFNAGASGGSITYTSSNLTVATIVSGNVHIVGAGTTTITANNGSTSAQQTLTVTPIPLTITANNQSKTYGSGNPALTVNYNGFVNGDTPSSLTTPPSVSTTASTGSAVGTYPITASGAVSANYTISYVAGTLTVGQATLTITANNQTKTQGAANPALTVNYNGFANGETNSALTTQPTVTTTATASSPVGTYPITASGAVDANYNISYVQGTLTVTGIALSFGPIPSKVYGSADFNPGATSSSSITYTSSNTSVATIVSGNLHIIGAGTSTITANDGSTVLQQTLTVTPAALSITANSVNKTYGSTLSGGTGLTAFTSSGLVNGETIGSVTIAYGTGSAATTGIGTYSGSVTPSAAAGGTFTASNYTITYTTNSIVVTPATLTITANNTTKVYGTAITGGTGSTAFTSSGLVNGQTIGTVTIVYGTGSAATANAGTYNGSVTPSAATGGTFTAGNYAITYNSGNITVSAAALSITANNVTKTYGTTLTGGTGSTAFTSSGLANGQTIGSVTIAYGTGASATTAVGSYTSSITPSSATGGTFTASNYVITYNKGNITVNAAALNIIASNVTKTYGSTITGGTGSTAFTATGLANSQTIGTVTIAYGTGSAATAAAGTYTGSVTPSAATGGTFTASNYTITYVTGSITVNKAALTITANNQTKTQGAANPTLTVSYAGFVNSETNTVLTTQPTVTTTATTSSPVGSYPITANGAAAANYTISYVAGTLTVTAASTLTFNPIPSKVYGAANFSPGATTTTGTITYTSGNTSVATIVSGNIHIVGVGTSTITANNGTTSLQQTLTVTKASLTITGGVTKTYGSTVTSGSGSTAFTSSGLVYSQTIGSVTITYGTGSAANAAVGTYSGSAVPSAATGGTFVAANYTITYVSGDIVVNKATLTITANNVTKSYGTSITGRTGSTAFTSSGLKNGQTIGSVTIAYGSGATATSRAGTYSGSVTPSAATGGTFIAADYTISYVSGNITVNKVPLTITANNQVKIQGNTNPTLTVSYSGFVNGETNTALTTQPTVTTTATTSSPVGTYPITASGAVDANYTITYVAGTLTINPSTAALISVVNPLHETYAPVAEPTVNQAVSPNSDGINDVLHIDNIESYPDNKVTLMNRNGTPIFEIAGYDNVNKVFDGHSNITKEMQRPGTYFYLLEYKVKGELKRKSSFFVIKY